MEIQCPSKTKSFNRMIMFQTMEFKIWLRELMITVYQFNKIRIKHFKMKVFSFINKIRTIFNKAQNCKYFFWEGENRAWNINIKKLKLIFLRFKVVLMELFCWELIVKLLIVKFIMFWFPKSLKIKIFDYLD